MKGTRRVDGRPGVVVGTNKDGAVLANVSGTKPNSEDCLVVSDVVLYRHARGSAYLISKTGLNAVFSQVLTCLCVIVANFCRVGGWVWFVVLDAYLFI